MCLHIFYTLYSCVYTLYTSVSTFISAAKLWCYLSLTYKTVSVLFIEWASVWLSFSTKWLIFLATSWCMWEQFPLGRDDDDVSFELYQPMSCLHKVTSNSRLVDSKFISFRLNRICGLMVSVLTSSAVDCGFGS